MGIVKPQFFLTGGNY